jgi:hypothetical protein
MDFQQGRCFIAVDQCLKRWTGILDPAGWLGSKIGHNFLRECFFVCVSRPERLEG